jgi:hypothetical protein
MTRMKKEDLEKKYDKITTKIKRDKHPNQWKYPGRSGNEHKMAMMKFMRGLSKEQMSLLSKNSLILNPENTNKFLEEIKVGDLVGVKDTIFKVLSKDETGFKGEPNNSEEMVDVSLGSIDYGLATEFAEILWRDDSVYGDPEEEITILVPKSEKKEETE